MIALFESNTHVFYLFLKAKLFLKIKSDSEYIFFELKEEILLHKKIPIFDRRGFFFLSFLRHPHDLVTTLYIMVHSLEKIILLQRQLD